MLQYEWDEVKAAANENKHGVNFDEPVRSSSIRSRRLTQIPITLSSSCASSLPAAQIAAVFSSLPIKSSLKNVSGSSARVR